MDPPRPPDALLGDTLARAREAWVRESAQRLARLGFADYRRSDSLATRLLHHGAVPLGDFLERFHLTRQGARRIVDGLVQRGYVHERDDPHDARRKFVELTDRGHDYAHAVMDTIFSLHDDLAAAFTSVELAQAQAVLQFVRDHFGQS